MMIKRVLSGIYGLLSYSFFFLTFLYLIGFVENIFVPKSLDSLPQENLLIALIIDLGLIALFALQHSGMARPQFKKWLLKTVPPHLERSTYVFMTCIALVLLFYFWSPLGGTVWQINNPIIRDVLYAISGLGWTIVLITTFLINHFDLFGLRQVYLYCIGKEYTHLEFKTIGFYQYVRHPLMLGFMIAFWATPTMTVTHLFFALAMTIYILIAIQLEERDLIDIYGSLYEEYKQQVSMLLPLPKETKKTQESMS